MLPSLESKSTSDSSLTGDSGVSRPEPEVKKDRIEAESESPDDRICCRAENRALVNDLETMEPESETDKDNSEMESESVREPL